MTVKRKGFEKGMLLRIVTSNDDCYWGLYERSQQISNTDFTVLDISKLPQTINFEGEIGRKLFNRKEIFICTYLIIELLTYSEEEKERFIELWNKEGEPRKDNNDKISFT